MLLPRRSIELNKGLLTHCPPRVEEDVAPASSSSRVALVTLRLADPGRTIPGASAPTVTPPRRILARWRVSRVGEAERKGVS